MGVAEGVGVTEGVAVASRCFVNFEAVFTGGGLSGDEQAEERMDDPQSMPQK